MASPLLLQTGVQQTVPYQTNALRQRPGVSSFGSTEEAGKTPETNGSGKTPETDGFQSTTKANGAAAQKPRGLVETITEFVQNVVNTVLQVATAILEVVHAFAEQRFPNDDKIVKLPMQKTPAEAAKHLSHLSSTLPFTEQGPFAVLRRPEENRLKQVLSQVNEGTPEGLRNTPASVYTLPAMTPELKETSQRMVEYLEHQVFGKDNTTHIDLSHAHNREQMLAGLKKGNGEDTRMLLVILPGHREQVAHAKANPTEYATMAQVVQQFWNTPATGVDQTLQEDGLNFRNALLVFVANDQSEVPQASKPDSVATEQPDSGNGNTPRTE